MRSNTMSFDINSEVNGTFQTRGLTHALALLQTPTGKLMAHCQFCKWTQSPHSLALAYSPSLSSFPRNRGPQLSAVLANISSSYPPPSLTILGMAVEILAQSTKLPACQEEQKADFKQQFNSTDINSKSSLVASQLNIQKKKNNTARSHYILTKLKTELPST